MIDVSAAIECVRLILGTESRAKLKQLFHCIHYCLITVIKSYANFLIRSHLTNPITNVTNVCKKSDNFSTEVLRDEINFGNWSKLNS